MMVNQVNNSGAPWQSTIPNQIPWMSAVSSSTPMQFGQTHLAPDNLAPTVIDSPVGNPIAQLPPTQIPLAHQIPNPDLYNPFDPNQVLSQLSANNMPTAIRPAVGSIFPTNMTESNTLSNEQSSNFESSFLTQLPQRHHYNQHAPTNCIDSQPLHQKRSSIEMEDEMTVKEAPPTKQQLSESRLFKRFGSLQLDNDKVLKDEEADIDSDDSDEGKSAISGSQNRSEFNRYVYLLFKDKKSNNLFDDSTSRAMDRLLREERDKLNKAVILWNPPVRNFYVSEEPDSDDDDGPQYKDHRDFLKKKPEDDDSIIITEVEDDVDIEDVSSVPDDVMQD